MPTTLRLTLLALLLPILASSPHALTTTHAADTQRVYLALVTGGQLPTLPLPPTPPADDAANLADRREVIRLVNIERVNANLPTDCGDPVLVEHPALMAGAQAWSEEMRRTGFRHSGGGNPNWYEREGFGRFQISAENLATSPNAATVVPQWMASEIHQSGILRCGTFRVGVGNKDGFYTLLIGVVDPS